MRSPNSFCFSHHGLGVDARLKLTSVFHYHPNDQSHSESIAVLDGVAESSTLTAASWSISSQHETSPQIDQAN
jgi:hypothetical protein